MGALLVAALYRLVRNGQYGAGTLTARRPRLSVFDEP